ncbi:nitrilase-related carbon-nitrogen hydrolase [Chryseobacterium koreense]|uniref:nitrilase-related carbon-nitrogen hydrolase n=1 Tax=Chryseobacterium koreense TaxID=232216 RepID=UPI0026E981F9|nr:nitrilase-related carbon-nitrogen hydrolase [Chryseobacterium koreense]
MKCLKITALNLDIIWKDKMANFNTLEKELENSSAEIFLLPEMFSTGFSMEPEEIADRNEESLSWLKKYSKARNTAICGSASIAENGKYHNRLYFVTPDGENAHYDKRHLFSYSGEDKVYSPGNERIIVDLKGWKILLQVCYDLRFPVFVRNNGDYDAIFYVANWPETRIDAWKTLLKARAIENQCYVFGVNRIGTDGNNLHYPESTYCFFADGSVVSEVDGNIVSAEFDREKLSEFRKRFRFLDDRDEFEIKY